MLRTLAILGLMACMAVSMGASRHSLPQHEATGRLEFTDGGCSGTYIAADQVLTADHCFEGGALKSISGVPCEQIGERLRDGNDHAIMRVSCKRKAWASVRGAMYAGLDVHLWGNPAGLIDIYRKGYVSGELDGWTLTMIPVNRGDSGSGVFDSSGHVVGVVSTLMTDGVLSFMGSKPFAFTREQWASVGQ